MLRRVLAETNARIAELQQAQAGMTKETNALMLANKHMHARLRDEGLIDSDEISDPIVAWKPTRPPR